MPTKRNSTSATSVFSPSAGPELIIVSGGGPAGVGVTDGTTVGEGCTDGAVLGESVGLGVTEIRGEGEAVLVGGGKVTRGTEATGETRADGGAIGKRGDTAGEPNNGEVVATPPVATVVGNGDTAGVDFDRFPRTTKNPPPTTSATNIIPTTICCIEKVNLSTKLLLWVVVGSSLAHARDCASKPLRLRRLGSWRENPRPLISILCAL